MIQNAKNVDLNLQDKGNFALNAEKNEVNMKKLSLILNLIFLFAFNLLAFVIPFNRDTIFVINLISVNITMILNLFFIIIYMNSKQKTKNRFLNLSILNLNYIFICIAIIIFIIFNIIPITKLWIPLTLDIILIIAIVVINTCLNKSVKYIEDYDKNISLSFVENGTILKQMDKKYHQYFMDLLIHIQNDKIKKILCINKGIVFENTLELCTLNLGKNEEVQILEIILSYKEKLKYNVNVDLLYSSMMIEIGKVR
jgi:hypothetical protein